MIEGKVILNMKKPTTDEKIIRDQLRDKRDRLFEEYSENPMNIRLAIEIKLIDDQLADLTEHLVQRTRSGLD